MSPGGISLLAAQLTVIFMGTSIVLAIVAHTMRRELDPVEMPFSAYLSGTSRRVGLACYGCLVSGITAFAIASATRPGLGLWSGIVSTLYLISVVFVAIAAATARADASLAHIDNPHARWWHRQSAFLAFSSAIVAIAFHTWLWREQEFLNRFWTQEAVLAAILVALFFLLLLSTTRFKGAVQKLLILGIVVWFGSVASMMQR